MQNDSYYYRGAMRIIVTLCAFWMLVPAHAATAQAYPTKPIRLVIHFPPGGPTDIIGRAVAQKFTETWGQQVIVDNRPSAGGVVGVEAVVRSNPDGYTLLFATGGSMSIAPAFNPKLPYNVFKDLEPVSLVVINPQILVFHPAFAPNSVKELVVLAKSRPGTINYASVGPGSPNHLGMEMLKSMAGIDMVHIPYKGTRHHLRRECVLYFFCPQGNRIRAGRVVGPGAHRRDAKRANPQRRRIQPLDDRTDRPSGTGGFP